MEISNCDSASFVSDLQISCVPSTSLEICDIQISIPTYGFQNWFEFESSHRGSKSRSVAAIDLRSMFDRCPSICFVEFLEPPKFKIRSISNVVRHLFILNLWVQNSILLPLPWLKKLFKTLEHLFIHKRYFLFPHLPHPILCQVLWILFPILSVSGFLWPLTTVLDLFVSSTSSPSFSRTFSTAFPAGTGHLCVQSFTLPFSGHFEPVSNFFVDHHSTSIFLFSSSLSNSGLDQLIDDLSFMNCLIRELISFHQFKGLQTPELLCSVLFSAADFLSVLLLVKFIRNVPPVLPATSNTENPDFSPVLSLITELDQTSAPSEEGQNDFDAHLELQHDLDLQEQNAQDVAAFNDWITGSGYNGLFWDEIEPSLWHFTFNFRFSMWMGRGAFDNLNLIYH